MTIDLSTRIARTIRRDVTSTAGYAIQPSAGMVKLDAMENPFSLPSALKRALGERLAEVAINRYPINKGEVAAALTQHFDVPAGCKLIVGNGSDELIDLLSVAGDVPGATVLAPLPGFVMYEMSARLRGLKFVGVPLTPHFELDEAAMLAAIEEAKPALTYMAAARRSTSFARSSMRSARKTAWSCSMRPTNRFHRAPGCPSWRRTSMCWCCARCRSSAWRACAWATSSAPRRSSSRLTR